MRLRSLAAIAAAAMLSSGAAQTSDWSEADKARHAAYLTLKVIDWRQTMDIRRHPDVKEGGLVARMVIGEQPSNSQINTYMVCSVVLTTVIADSLDPDWRAIFQSVMIADTAVAVRNNNLVELNFKF